MQKLVWTDGEVCPGCPALEEAKYLLSFPQVAPNHSGIICKLGPQ